MEALMMTGVFVVAAGAAALWWGAHEGKRRDDAWSAFARSRGGKFSEGSVLGFDAPRIDLAVEHAIVRIDRFNEGKLVCTRASAQYCLGAGPPFRVRPSGALTSLVSALGARDVRLGGDDRFDEMFTVRCDVPVATREAWTPEAMRLMRHFSSRTVTAHRKGVRIVVPGVITGVRQLGRMVDLVGTLASVGGRVLEQYATLENSGFTNTTGPFMGHTPPQLMIQTSRGPVRVRVAVGAEGSRVRAQISHDLELAPFDAEIKDATEIHGMPRGLVSEAALAMIGRLGSVGIVGGAESLKIAWPGAPSPETLQVGVDLLVELAAGRGQGGAFR